MIGKKHAYRERYIETPVKQDLARKMVFIAGPRQCGKTTLARHVGGADGVAGAVAPYAELSWDSLDDRRLITEERFQALAGTVFFDELHKYRRWRQVLKGLYDKRGHELRILVTGSARLDYYRRGGDSLQGRYHCHRLFPFTLAELGGGVDTLRDLLAYGPFPEPFLSGSETYARRWSREYHERLVREDLRDLEHVLDVSQVERLAQRLPALVGSPLSINALREDLEVSHGSVARWIRMFETLYFVFRVYPFGAPRVRAVKKEAKHYHMDWGVVQDPGARFENLVACHLWKWCCFRQDTEGRDTEVRYFRDTDKREVDFVVLEGAQPVRFVECKLSARDPSPHLRYLHARFPQVEALQVSPDPGPDVLTREGIRLCPADVLLRELV